MYMGRYYICITCFVLRLKVVHLDDIIVFIICIVDGMLFGSVN